MKIILYYPRGYDNSGNTQRPIASLAATMAPIGLASIAAVLRESGHDVKIFDGALKTEITNETWAKIIVDEQPDIVGISSITPSFHDAYDLCTRVKSLNSSIQTVFGGVHPSWGKGTLLADYPQIDVVIAGEGEYAFRDIANDVDPSTIAGVFSRNGDTIVAGPAQCKATLCTMDDLPFPAYDLIEGFPDRYEMALFNYPKHPTASVISSRGCVYHCSFCDRSVFAESFRWNSPEYTAAQVEKLAKEYGVKHVMFYDDLFTLNRKRVSRLCELLKQSKYKVTFNCIVRIGHIDDDLIRELKEAGCWMVNVGIESGDQDILDQHKETLSLEKIREDVKKIHQAGIWVKGLFMMGFPGETEESAHKTIAFASSLPLKDANLTAFTPYPGAPIYKDIQNLGAFDESPENWKNLTCTNFVFVPNEAKSKERLEQLYGQFFRRFYNRSFARKCYNKMFIQSPHSYWRVLRNLPRYLGYITGLGKKPKGK